MRMVIVAAVALLTANAAAAQERGWLAIGTDSVSHAFSFGSADDAVNSCGFLDCEVVETFTACLAVAYSSETTSGRPVWTWTEATTEADANGGALDECTDAGGLACAVMNTYCLDSGGDTAQQDTTAVTAAQENLFWQSIMNRTNPADFEAYLELFPNGVFRRWQRTGWWSCAQRRQPLTSVTILVTGRRTVTVTTLVFRVPVWVSRTVRANVVVTQRIVGSCSSQVGSV